MPRLQALREQDIDPAIQPDIQAGKELMEFVSNDALNPDLRHPNENAPATPAH